MAGGRTRRSSRQIARCDPARALSGDADRRIPGYGRTSVENLSAGVHRRRRRQHRLRNRGSQAGDLRISWRRRARLPGSARATLQIRRGDCSLARKFPFDRRHDRGVQPDVRSECRGAIVHRWRDHLQPSGHMRASRSASRRGEQPTDRTRDVHEVPPARRSIQVFAADARSDRSAQSRKRYGELSRNPITR